MDLFSSYRLGTLELPNRVVMAPMTRSRAPGALPNDLMRTYYTQRASAGLIITEGIAPSANALGYSRIPGLFSQEQTAAWRPITDSVHAAGGRIIAQLMHVGRVAHPLNLPAGSRMVAPSAVAASIKMWTDQEGLQPVPAPEAMNAADLSEARDVFVQAARNAIAAGFDGVELHGANGYLLEQFLNPRANHRQDTYGGSVENRARFVLEVVHATADAIGAERLGIRLSPFNTYNDVALHDEMDAQYTVLARGLKGLQYVHVVANPHADFPATLRHVHEAFGGPLMLNGGFDLARAQATLAAGQADLISFARPFIANPDLVLRLRQGAALAVPDASTFYTPGPQGYVDYPALAG